LTLIKKKISYIKYKYTLIPLVSVVTYDSKSSKVVNPKEFSIINVAYATGLGDIKIICKYDELTKILSNC